VDRTDATLLALRLMASQPAAAHSWVHRTLVLCCGLLAYLLGAAVTLYFVGFLAGWGVPHSLASEPDLPAGVAVLVDVGLLLVWGLQHSVMARPGFKLALRPWVPACLERSLYVLVSSVGLALLMVAWQPIAGTVWHLSSALAQGLVWSLFALGGLITTVATVQTDHMDLLGLRQCWLFFQGRPHTAPDFVQGLLYRWIRHPMMLGFLIAMWATPHMQLGHLVFALGMSIYVLIGIYFEERDAERLLGDHYRTYRAHTARLIPGLY
jgi:protein-S-isoprenylcysteine O-methyltransferase Ste14